MTSNNDFDQLSDSALIRQKQLLQVIPYSAPTLWRRVKSGTFPQPIRMTDARMTCWRVGDVRSWLAAQSSQAVQS